MEILLEEDHKKKPSPTRPSAYSSSSKQSGTNTKIHSQPTIKRTKKETQEFDSLVSVTERPTTKKKVIKRVVKKVRKVPQANETQRSGSTPTGILEPLTNFSLNVGNNNELPDPDAEPTEGPNPYSFFKFDDDPTFLPPIQEDQNTSNLPSLSSDESDDGGWDDDHNSKQSPIDMLLNLPDVSDDGPQLPNISGTNENLSWKERALQAERNSAVWQNKYLQQKEELKEAQKRIKKLKAKEAHDAEQMDDVLKKVERNLQQSRNRYEERLNKMKQELMNTKRMLQHVTQTEDIEIPDNFEEYQEFIQNGKSKALYASDQLKTLATNAETQVQNLLKGCTALKELATLLSSVDTFSDQQPPSL